MGTDLAHAQFKVERAWVIHDGQMKRLLSICFKPCSVATGVDEEPRS